jgi:FG-GAP repeat protein
LAYTLEGVSQFMGKPIGQGALSSLPRMLNCLSSALVQSDPLDSEGHMVPSSSSRGIARGLFFVIGLMLIVGLALLPARVTYSSDPYALVRTFTNPGGSSTYSFGASVAWVGSKALIGAPGYDPGDANGAGAAYVYANVLNVSVQPITLTKSVPITAEHLGTSVTAFGTQALVGVPGDSSVAVQAGAAYIFDTITGQIVITMTNPDPDNFENFGEAVTAVAGNVVAGAPKVSFPGPISSAGEAYWMNGTNGVFINTLANPSPASFESFGSAVAAYGADVLIGAKYDGGSGTDYGAVYLFDLNSLTVLRTITNPTPGPNDLFGISIAVFGNKVLIGAPNDDTAASDAGAAYLFNGDTGQLLHTFTLTATTHSPASDDYFGTAVSLNGQHILIGTPGRDGGASAADAGAAYLFDATNYSFIQVFPNPSPASGEGFGASVAVNTNLFLVGAPRVGGTVGEAYLFSFAPPTPTPVAKVFAPLIRRAILPTP